MGELPPLPVPKENFEALSSILGLGPDGKPELSVVHFTRLECQITEDSAGPDEPILTIYPNEISAGMDSATQSALDDLLTGLGGMIVESSTDIDKHVSTGYQYRDEGIDEGDDVPVPLALPLLPGRPIRIKLMEEDGGVADPDDHIRTVNVERSEIDPRFLQQNPSPLEGVGDLPVSPLSSIVLSGDDAYYELDYTLINIRLEKEQESGGVDVKKWLERLVGGDLDGPGQDLGSAIDEVLGKLGPSQVERKLADERLAAARQNLLARLSAASLEKKVLTPSR